MQSAFDPPLDAPEETESRSRWRRPLAGRGPRAAEVALTGKTAKGAQIATPRSIARRNRKATPPARRVGGHAQTGTSCHRAQHRKRHTLPRDWSSPLDRCRTPGRERQTRRLRSDEGDRLVWLFLDRNPHLCERGNAHLAFAPEATLRARLEPTASEYVSGDLTATFGDGVLDATRLDLPSASSDVVICNHVLEHVPDDRAAVCELRRVLRPGGWALLLAPDVRAEKTIEDPSIVDAAERRRLYGQADHVRRYGFDYLDRLLSARFVPRGLST